MAATLAARCSPATGCRHRSHTTASELAAVNDASRTRADSTAAAAPRACAARQSTTLRNQL